MSIDEACAADLSRPYRYVPSWWSIGVVTLAALVVFSGTATASTAACQTTGRFEDWLDGFRRGAAAAGVKPATISEALGDMVFDPTVIQRDRRQGFFAQSFVAFQAKLISRNRITKGLATIDAHRATFARAERDYGVPASVIAAFWALESDFGAGLGKFPVLRALATLAYDCRRKEMFERELLAALRIIDRGDLSPDDMIGSWAGELGQTQFLPTHYLAHAVDYDGDGRRDLFSSPADIIGSTAAYIKHLGWRGGEPWLEEVRIPANLDWQQADLAVQHPRATWAAWGVTRADGRPLPKDALPASLLLMMGRSGPAFLAYGNFRVYTEWNHSLTYATTAAYLATLLGGAQPIHNRGEGIPVLTPDQTRELQTLLNRLGLDAGEVDGKIGAGTRAAVKAAQLRLGLPADSYPTPDLIARLRAGR